MSTRTPPRDRPVIDVEATEVPRPATRPAPAAPFAGPPAAPTGALQMFQAQRELLAAQHRAMQEMFAQLPVAAAPPGAGDYRELLARSLQTLDRSLHDVMAAMRHTIGSPAPTRPDLDPEPEER